MEKYKTFFKNLQDLGFEGEIKSDISERILASTDNSIYQIIPDIVIYPKVVSDLNKIVIASKEEAAIKLNAKGGATGTNGQSLNYGICVDCSKYLTKISEINLKAKYAIVEPGVVLKQLNTKLSKHGYMFCPSVSPSNRATIGGMVATDASGKGSRIYGKTSDHLIALDMIDSSGSDYQICSLTKTELSQELAKNTFKAKALKVISDIINTNSAEIDRVFPKTQRTLSGYNLSQARLAGGGLNPLYVIAGSEGSLGFIKKIKLKIKKTPKYERLVVASYKNFNESLSDLKQILEYDPFAVELLDHKIIKLAKGTGFGLEAVINISDLISKKTKSQDSKFKGDFALVYIELRSNDRSRIDSQSNRILSYINSIDSFSLGGQVVDNLDKINKLWSVRQESVGLLSRKVARLPKTTTKSIADLDSLRQGQAFIEDCLVPVENLQDFVTDLDTLIRKEKLEYGIYGHGDVGCLHLRPAINIYDSDCSSQVERISDQAFKLVERYGGIFFGEHGKGMRSSYNREVFGSVLYSKLQEIKHVFDPKNKFNPNKITIPKGHTGQLFSPTSIDLRGMRYNTIPLSQVELYNDAFRCNGNGACFDYSYQSTTCPSFKASKDKRYSPKGRANLIKEWLLYKTYKTDRPKDYKNFEALVFDSFSKCLSCSSCLSGCPLSVDIPELKSLFLDEYFKSNRKGLLLFMNELLLDNFEKVTSIFAKVRNFFPNYLARLLFDQLGTKFIELIFFQRNLPRLANNNLYSLAKGYNIKIVDQGSGVNDQEQSSETIVILADPLTSFYHEGLLESAIKLLTKLKYKIYFLDLMSYGKTQHTIGYRQKLKSLANKNSKILNKFEQAHLHLLCLEPNTTHFINTYYAKLGYKVNKEIQTISKFLHNNQEANNRLTAIASKSKSKQSKQLNLILQCSEKSLLPQTFNEWQGIFSIIGYELINHEIGCCGMSGSFGHSVKNREMSKQIFNLSWQEVDSNYLISGYSCSEQVFIRSGFKTIFPLEKLEKSV